MSSTTHTSDRANSYLLRFVLATAAVVGFIASFNYVVDPLQLFHRPWFYAARYTDDPRLGDVGLIESQTFDTAFMGTSFSYAIRQSEIDEALALQLPFLKISESMGNHDSKIVDADSVD